MKRLSKAVVCTVAGLMTVSGGLAQRPSEEHVPSRLLVQTSARRGGFRRWAGNGTGRREGTS
jgi:hypothetical protein